MLQGEHSAILSTFIKLPFVIKIIILSIFELPFYTGFTVCKKPYKAGAIFRTKNIGRVWVDSVKMTTKRSDAQPLETTTLGRESKLHAIAYGFLRLWYKTSSESILIINIMSIYFSHNKLVPVIFWNTFIMQKVHLTKRENFLTLYLYHKRRNPYA